MSVAAKRVFGPDAVEGFRRIARGWWDLVWAEKPLREGELVRAAELHYRRQQKRTYSLTVGPLQLRGDRVLFPLDKIEFQIDMSRDLELMLGYPVELDRAIEMRNLIGRLAAPMIEQIEDIAAEHGEKPWGWRRKDRGE